MRAGIRYGFFQGTRKKTMDPLKKKIEEFFQEYEARFEAGIKGDVDIDGTTAAFANCFVEASPVGITCGQNDTAFREAIPKGYDFYKSIGTQSMKIIAREIIPLDDFHFICKVHWRASYLKKNTKNEEIIDFDVFYVLQHLNGTLKIFAYITGDEQKVLKERGLT
jgi:hypothetical protein